MSDSVTSPGRLSDEARIAKVKTEEKRSRFQLTMISIIGVLAFLLLWQIAVMMGWLPSRYVPMPTDVLSFPQNELEPGRFDPAGCERDLDTGAVLLGDMMISLPRCESQGQEFGHGFKREIMYLTVHSVLHLLGYDHMDEGEMKAQMRAREKAIMGDDI